MAKKTDAELLAEANAKIAELQIDGKAIAAEREDLATEKAAFEKHKKTETQALTDAADAHKATVDKANRASFERSQRSRKQRCKEPLNDEERAELAELERRARTHGPDDQPSPAEMGKLGEFRIRAKLG